LNTIKTKIRDRTYTGSTRQSSVNAKPSIMSISTDLNEPLPLV